jgi:hypothetical protein
MRVTLQSEQRSTLHNDLRPSDRNDFSRYFSYARQEFDGRQRGMFTISNTQTYEMTHPGKHLWKRRSRFPHLDHEHAVSKRGHFARSSVSKRANPLDNCQFEVACGSRSL